MSEAKRFWVVFLILLAGCAVKPEQAGDETEGYERIISLGPAITQNVYLLGREEALVGISSYCALLPGVSGKEIAGDLVNANIEQIIKLSPDVVMVTGMAGRGMVERIKSFGIKVVSFTEPESFNEICLQFTELGRLLGAQDRAEEILARARGEIDGLRAKAGNLPPKSVIAQIGAEPLWVSPRSSFINDIIEFAGGINMGPRAGGMVSVEKVIKQNPDVILIIDMGIAEEQKKMWQNYPALNAVKNGRIYVVDSFVFCSPTPEIFTEAVRRAFKILHEK